MLFPPFVGAGVFVIGVAVGLGDGVCVDSAVGVAVACVVGAGDVVGATAVLVQPVKTIAILAIKQNVALFIYLYYHFFWQIPRTVELDIWQ
jgi:hypothetical protein